MEGEEPTIDTQPNAASPPQAHAEIVTGGREGEHGTGKESLSLKIILLLLLSNYLVLRAYINTTTIPGCVVEDVGHNNAARACIVYRQS